MRQVTQDGPAPALVMNMMHTGLGIARSLGEQGIPVIGLSAQRRVFGNFTRYAQVVLTPDSRNEPEALLAFLTKMGRELGRRGVLFPTRDDDVEFLDRYREELTRYFILAVPETGALHCCLNKWETHGLARRAGVPTPQCWLIGGEEDLDRIAGEIAYPCVLKPLLSHAWRKADNWAIVGARKAIAVSSREELFAEYASISRAGPRVLVQRVVPGGDDSLVTAAVYLDRQSRCVAGFNTQKLLQVPAGFGTGCIVQTANRPELFEPTLRLLQRMNFTGIAEVEYKWDAAEEEYKLIEINPRPWDQHRLGKACGTDLAYLAYCDYAGRPYPAAKANVGSWKWIAEDTFLITALPLLRRRDPQFRSLFRLARGKRIYAIWSARDPLPLLGYLLACFFPSLMGAGVRAMRSAFKGAIHRKALRPRKV